MELHRSQTCLSHAMSQKSSLAPQGESDRAADIARRRLQKRLIRRTLFGCLLASLSVVVVYQTMEPLFPDTVVSNNFRHAEPPPISVEPEISGMPGASIATAPITLASGVPPESETSSSFSKAIPVSIVQSPASEAPRSPSESRGMAGVDFERLLAGALPSEASESARAETIERIKQAVATCVSAHAFVLVLDTSGKSINGIPVVMRADGIFDLTDEVRAELGHARK